MRICRGCQWNTGISDGLAYESQRSAFGVGPLGFDPQADYGPLLLRAFDSGINFFDTADLYGAYRSEEWIGNSLSAHRDEILVATKFGSMHKPGEHRQDFSVAHMRRSLGRACGVSADSGLAVDAVERWNVDAVFKADGSVP